MAKMKHIKLYENFINEASTKHFHVIRGSKPLEWWTGSDFSTNPADAMKYNMETADMVAKREKALVHPMTDSEMKKAIKSFKANESTELDEALNELSLSSVGVKSFLKAMYTNADVIKKLGFGSFKDLVGYIKGGNIEEWDELRNEVKELGIVIAESTVEEGTFSPINQLAKDEQDEGHDAKIFVGHFDGRTFKAQSTNKTWDDGVPVMKNFTRGGFKDVKLKGEFQLVDSDRGWWYIQGPASTWYAVKHADYGTPPFEY